MITLVNLEELRLKHPVLVLLPITDIIERSFGFLCESTRVVHSLSLHSGKIYSRCWF